MKDNPRSLEQPDQLHEVSCFQPRQLEQDPIGHYIILCACIPLALHVYLVSYFFPQLLD